ncbi:MAG: phosphoenolpyruvate--protein phosphotransferase [Rhodanobacteraceae bacterium]
MAVRQTIKGSGAARGMALGRARLVHPGEVNIDKRPLPDDQVEDEVARLDAAMLSAGQDLADLRDKVHGSLAGEVAEFIGAHKMLLEDPELKARLHHAIRQQHQRASHALNVQRDQLVATFDAMDDPYLRARREDVDQVIHRVQNALQLQTSNEEKKLAKRVGEILVSDGVGPAEMAHLAGHGLLGVIATGGSVYSHSAILARSMRLPMLVGVQEALAEINDGDLVLIDAENDVAIVHPAAQDLVAYRKWQREAAVEGRRLAALAGAPSDTADGQRMALYANAEMPAEVTRSRHLGAAGIGLYRTEFLFLKRDGAPDEDEQFEAYRTLVLGMAGLPVTIRTLDLGADKIDRSGLALKAEDNPALGVRGVRLSLRRPTVFAVQLRAILRAASYGPVRILVPMVTVADEMKAVRTLVDMCLRDLRNDGQEVPEQVDIGAMIEVPAAAIGIRTLLAECDFIAIGTNDLAQYVLAVDRNHDALEELYDPLQPALLRLVANVIACAKRAGKPVSLCGEIAGDPRFTALLLALGLTDFSMHPGQILQVRDTLSELHRGKLRKLAPRLLHAASRDEVEQLLIN